MAITTDLERHRGRSTSTAVTVTTPAEHAKRVARSVRHSRAVRALRWVLPVAGVAIVGLYVVLVMETIGWVDGLPKVAMPQILPENLTMDNPRYEGFNKDGGSYVVAADTAIQSLTDTSKIQLNGITADMVDATKVKTSLKAVRGDYNTKTGVLDLFENINITSSSGMRASMTSATIRTKENEITSKEPVTVEMPGGTVRSNELKVRSKTREVTFLHDVKAHLTPKVDADESGTAAAASAASASLLDASSGPIDITSHRLDVNDAGKTAVFSGNVKAVQGNAVLETKELEIGYAGPPGGTAPSASAASGASAKLAHIQSKSPVVITRAPQDRITGQRLDFDAIKNVAVLSGDVVITSGTESRIIGDTATMDQAADTILLTGDIVAQQGRNVLKGRRLFVKRASGQTELTSPPVNGSGQSGRISARFYNTNANTQTTTAKPKSTSEEGSSAAVFKTDPNAPIDIEADKLNVDDGAKAAVFTGNVRAVQGDVVMRTSQLRAHYVGAAGLTAASSSSANQEPARLKLVEALNKVIVTSKDGQKASGDWAKFDIKKNTVTLGGDVVLTQEKNVVRGTQLVINMTTGQTVIQTAPGAAWSARSSPAGQAKKGDQAETRPVVGGRPSAVFYPSLGKKKGARKKPSGSGTGSSGWAPSTAP